MVLYLLEWSNFPGYGEGILGISKFGDRSPVLQQRKLSLVVRARATQPSTLLVINGDIT